MRRRQARPHRFAFLVLVALQGSATLNAQGSIPRQVAAPASDILAGVVRLPEPSSTATASRAAVLPLRFERQPDGVWAATVELPVERDGPLALALLSPDAGSWDVLVRRPGEAALRPITEGANALDRRVAPAGEELPGWVVDRYDVRDARAGAWTIRVEAARLRRSAPAEGWLLASARRDLRPSAQRDLRIEAWVTTQRLVAGEPIGVAARAPAQRIDRARIALESRGGLRSLPMQDDGLHEDGQAGDGLFGALVPPDVSGPVLARVEVEGRTAEERVFLRTVQIAFPVLEPRLFLEGRARATALDAEHLELEIGALPLGPVQRLHVSAEVWGRAAGGRTVPVCWLSRQLDPEMRSEVQGGRWFLPLVLDARWLAFAGAGAPLELREVRVQDPATEVVLDRAETMPVDVRSLPAAISPVEEIVPEMLTGGTSFGSGFSGSLPHKPPQWHSPGLMLVHGYCSGGSPWPAADFTQPKLSFLDPNQNRTHNQFAQLIDQQARAAGFSSFGVVAHSQGGCAALHLLTYYASGLDLAAGGRRIQSLASPYQGTPLASFGGFSCGVNNDMTPSGSATWLAGIPSWARAEVWFWTTSDAGNACSGFTDWLLADPEDGTVEVARGQLPGGNSMGNTTGWCHTTGMGYPAGYTDHPRNQAMNAAASR